MHGSWHVSESLKVLYETLRRKSQLPHGLKPSFDSGWSLTVPWVSWKIPVISCKKQKAENGRFNLLVQGKLCCVRSICGVVSPARSKQMVAGTESDYTDTTQSNLIIILAPGCVWYSRWRLFFLLRLLRHEATDFRARRRLALFLKMCPQTTTTHALLWHFIFILFYPSLTTFTCTA